MNLSVKSYKGVAMRQVVGKAIVFSSEPVNCVLTTVRGCVLPCAPMNLAKCVRMVLSRLWPGKCIAIRLMFRRYGLEEHTPKANIKALMCKT